MRVAIVTEPLVDNYGGVLQNYALQMVLKRMGHKPITLNYLPSLSFWHYLLYLGKNVLLYPMKRKPVKPYHRFIQRPEAFDRFIAAHIEITRPMKRYRLPKGIDALVVGSDQVWRREYNEHLEDMFLDFAKSRDLPKIAYAASLGVEKWNYSPKQTARAKELLKSFSAVSVRESSGVRLLEEHLDCRAELVLDPTLLLGREDYEKLCSSIPKAGEPFIAAYILDSNQEKTDFIKDLSQKRGLPVKSVTVSSDSLCSVEEWIALFRDAEYVVTDSFHGTVFSMVFGKPFHVFLNESRGTDRFITLARLCGLDLSEKNELGVVPYLEQLTGARSFSLKFLEKNLKK